MFIFIVGFLWLPRLNSIGLPDGGRELNTALAGICRFQFGVSLEAIIP